MALVCTYDAFEAYCVEAEQNGIDGYGLYHWTKATIEDPCKEGEAFKIICVLFRRRSNLLEGSCEFCSKSAQEHKRQRVIGNKSYRLKPCK